MFSPSSIASLVALSIVANIFIICWKHKELVVEPKTRAEKKELSRLIFFASAIYLWRGIGPWLMLPARILWMIAKGMRRGYLLSVKSEKKL